MNEAAMVFEMQDNPSATPKESAPLDRISVRDYIREVEIGAFRSERGVTQRIRFTVVLEVSPHAAVEADDVDRVISYDTIVQAIEAQLAAERINLLETLAERIASRCLADPRAVRAFVRIEKLDRIPGALGVEIVRSRAASEEARPHSAAGSGARGPALRPRVVYLGPAALEGADAADWREALARCPQSLILCVGPTVPQPRATGEAMLHVGLLSIEQNAWGLVGRDERFSIAASRAELDWALRNRRLCVWAPSKMLTDAIPRPALDASRPEALAAWLAAELDAAALAVAAAPAPTDPPSGLRILALTRPQDLDAID